MAETVTNRGKYLLAHAGMNGRDLRMLIILGTQTGVNDPDLNTVSELDAVTSVTIHSERIALTGESITEDDVNNRVNLDSDNVVFAAAPGVTAQGAAIFVEAANDTLREVVAIYTTGFPQPMDGGLTVSVPDWLRAS